MIVTTEWMTGGRPTHNLYIWTLKFFACGPFCTSDLRFIFYLPDFEWL